MSAAYPKLICTGCYQNAQASSYHSCPQITLLDKNLRAHPLQSNVPNLSCNSAVLPAHVPSRTLHHPVNPLYPIIVLSHPFRVTSQFSSHVLQPSHIHIFGMPYNLNFALFLSLYPIIANHKTSSSSGSYIHHSPGLPFKTEMSTLQKLLS